MPLHENVVQKLLEELYTSSIHELDARLRTAWELALHNSSSRDSLSLLGGNTNDVHLPPLMDAVMHGCPNTVCGLISDGENVNELVDGVGTPLIWAAIHGQDGIVQALVGAGADTNLNEYADARHRHLAVSIHIGLADSLEEELDANGVLYDSAQAALAKPAIEEHRLIAQCLREPSNIFIHYGNTALMYAAMKGNLSIVRTLLCAGADVNALGSDGFSAAGYAAIFRHVEVLKELIGGGAMSFGMRVLLHTAPLFPGGLCWIAAALLGCENATANDSELCNAVPQRRLRQGIKAALKSLHQEVEKALPSECHWPPVPQVLRAIQRLRLFRRMVRRVSGPCLRSRSEGGDAAQPEQALFMTEFDESNGKIVGQMQALDVPNEVVVLIREHFLRGFLVHLSDKYASVN